MSGVEKGDRAPTASDKKVSMSLAPGVPCSTTVKESDTTFEGKRNPSRTMETFPPEHDEEIGERSVTYYFPITFTEERTFHSDMDKVKACV